MSNPTAKFHHGHPLMVDHTPTAAVAAGDVVVTNDTPRIAHVPIPANTLGALGARGGVYIVPKATGAGKAIVDDKRVYWDATNKVVTTTSTGNKGFGITVGATTDDDTTAVVIHSPF